MGKTIIDATQAAAELKALIDDAQSVVFFGGAGVSTASGIPDFRSPTGLYSQKFKWPPEYMLSHSCYVDHPEDFFDFYRDRVLALDAKPNQAHLKLAELEAQGKLTAVITQNIDGLHQAAGSQNVFELHGSVLRNYCEKCGTSYTAQWVRDTKGVPTCEKCGGRVKPDVVLYEEGLDNDVLTGAAMALATCDLLIIGGTSLVVYPAAALVPQFFRGSTLVICNLEPTPQDASADLICACDIAKAFDF